jgi:hypothetical protein
MLPQPSRFPWEAGFPPVLIHAQSSEVTTHPWFAAARSGNVDAAALLVADTVSGEVVDRLAALAQGARPLLASRHAQQCDGLNVLPDVLAHALHALLGWEVDTELVQANIVAHARDPGFGHLAGQAVFAGRVQAGRAYVLVDDVIRRGGTLARLRGHILRHGGQVLGATVLAGNAPAAVLPPPPSAAAIKRLGVRGAPGIGAFVVALRLDQAGPGQRALTAAEIERLRATRAIVAGRARALFVLRSAMPPPVHRAVGA